MVKKTQTHIIRSIILINVLLLFSTVSVEGQNITSRLTIQKGGSLNFPFNSYEKMEDGIAYNNWTRLTVFFADSTTIPPDANDHWELLVAARTTQIDGDGSIFMPLNKIEVRVDDDGSGTAISGTWVVITDTFPSGQKIIGNGANETDVDNITISYRVGGTNAVLGAESGYYNVDLIFTLQKEP